MSLKHKRTDEQSTNSTARGAAVFEQVSDELSRMADATHRLQKALGVVLEDYSKVEGAAPLDLQEVDEITQTLENLAQFMNALSAPQELVLDSKTAAKYLTLNRLAKRLSDPESSSNDQSDDQSDDHDNGEIDLF
ncbi:MAG: hypothetical protein AAF720_04355 [Pseudomonadota bacterium]